MILIKKNITAQGQQITLETFLEESYSVTIINGKQKIIFLQDMSQSYMVDELQKKLVVVPGSAEQLAQIKNLLGGRLYEKRRALLEENTEYSDWLRQYYAGASFSFPTDVTSSEQNRTEKLR